MRTFILILFIFQYAYSSFAAAKFEEKLSKANEYFENFAYSDAVKLYLDIENSGIGTTETKLKIAECYRLQKDYINAEMWYEKFAGSGMVKDEYMFNYAEVLRNNGKYKDAIDWYQKYALIDAKGNTYIDYCKQFQNTKLDTIFKVKNVVNLNSKNDDFGPVFYKEGLVFTSARGNASSKTENYTWNGQPWLDVFQINELPKGIASKDIKAIVGEVNTDMHEGPVSFSNDGNTMYFTRNNYFNKKKGKADDNKTIKLSIYSATWDGKQWASIKPFSHNSANYSCGHPALSSDGERLYFASDMPGSKGGTDIYVCFKQGEGWGTPVNLGGLINTDRNEMFPYINSTDELFFSSEGHPGFGGLDIFKAELNEDDEWQPPVNMMSPINSSYDDFSFVYDALNGFGYFASNRKNGTGGDDIYYVVDAVKDNYNKKKKQCFKEVNGYIVDKNTNKNLPGVNVTVSTLDGINVFETVSDENGYYSISIPCDYDSLIVTFNDSKYFVQKMGLNPKTDPSPLKKDILLDKIVIDKAIIVKNIYYDLDKYYIRPDAAIELDKLAKFLLDNPTVLIELSSHTDCRASSEYNMTLSDNRAKSAVEYLIQKGINIGRLYPKGYGETKLVNGCSDGVKCTEDEHQQNRRTEFRVIGYDKVIYADSGSAKVEKIFISSDYQKLTNSKITYKIQLGVLAKSNEVYAETLSDLGVVTFENVDNKYKYFLGTYSNSATANTFLNKVKKRGVPDAFLVPYYNGKPISLEDALNFER